MRKVIIFVVICILFPIVSAQYIYGDIYIGDDGDARFYVRSDIDPEIKGITFNEGVLKGVTSELTSKQKGIWNFSLGLGSYENILLDIHLPKNLQSLMSVQGVDMVIDFNDRVISLIDQNKELTFSVSYEVGDTINYSWFYFLIILALIAGIVFFVFNFKKKTRKLRSIFPLIGENEEKILKLLMKESMRQKQIREKLNIPKASFTRYILNLEKKKLILREGEGKNKILSLR